MLPSFVEHIVSLTLREDVDEDELIRITELTRLTALALRIGPIDFQAPSTAAAALANLQGLRELDMFALYDDTNLAELDLSPLSQLTRLKLSMFHGSTAGASTAHALCQLCIDHEEDHPDVAALRSLRSLTCLEDLECTWCGLINKLEALSHLTSLTRVFCNNMQHADVWDGFTPRLFCQAITPFTSLQELTLTQCRCKARLEVPASKRID